MGVKKWVGRFAGGGGGGGGGGGVKNPRRGKQRALCMMVYVKIVNRDLSGSG